MKDGNASAAGVRAVMVMELFPPRFSGAAIQSFSMIPFLEERGAEMRVVTAHEGPRDVEEDYEGVRVCRLAVNGGGWRGYRFALRAARWLWRHRREWDVLHVHGICQAVFLSVPVARAAGKGRLLQLCMAVDEDPARIRRGRGGALKLRVLRQLDRYVCPSEALAREYEASSLDSAKIERIPYGVDLRRFRCPSPPARAAAARAIAVESGWDPASKLVLFCGGIEYRKGVDLLVQAWPAVLREQPEARLLLVGPTDHAATTAAFVDGLKSALREAGVLGTVRFTGRTEEPERFFEASDVFAFPSRKEGLGIVQLEAQVAGLPIVATELPGITSDIVAEGETGFIVPQEDAAGLGEAIRALLADPGLLQRMRAAAAKRGRERYGMAEVAARYVDLYEELRRGD